MTIYIFITQKPNPIETVRMGQAFSMGAVLLVGGTKGQRRALPNSRILLYLPIGGAGGQASDIERHAKEILQYREQLNRILADSTGQPLAQIEKDADRDFFLSASEAQAYGLIDEILFPESPQSAEAA